MIEAGIAHYRRGDLPAAARVFERVLRQEPRHARALNLLGCVRLLEGRGEEAVRLLRQSVALSPGRPEPLEDLARALLRSGQPESAATEAERVLHLDPDRPQPYNVLGLAELDLGRPLVAVERFREALQKDPRHFDAVINLAVAMNRLGEHESARRVSEAALRLAPGDPRAWTNLGMAHKGMRRLDDALAAFEAAGDYPAARFNRGYVHLLRDDLERGLPLYEARKELLGIGRGMTRPEWDGAPGPGRTLLVVHEQGMGDTILAARFLPRLFESFASVVALVPGPLARLVGAVDPRVRVVTAVAGVRYDRWCGFMSLAHRLGIRRIEDVPLAPWFPAVARRGRAPGNPRIGINWAGNPRFAQDHVRSTHLASLALLLRVPGVEWCSLHRGHLEHEAAEFGLSEPLRDAADFLDTARVIAGLDLVISTETAVPNLAAALGVPTCVLAAPDVDWRWRSWYADVTVCLQDAPGEWAATVAGALEFVRDRLGEAAPAA